MGLNEEDTEDRVGYVGEGRLLRPVVEYRPTDWGRNGYGGR